MILNGFVVLLILPRSIGPTLYGEYSYILSTAMFLVQTLLAGLVPAYVHFMNSPSTSVDLVAYRFMVIFTIVTGLCLVATLCSFSIEVVEDHIWLGSLNNTSIFLTVSIGFLKFFEERIVQYADVAGKTIVVEIFRLLSRSSFSAVLIILWMNSVLNLELFLFLNVAVWGLFIIQYLPRKRALSIQTTDWRKFLLRTYDFSWAVYVFLFFGAFYTYFGRHLLAQSNSFEEQANFYAGFQLGTVFLPLVSAYTALTMKKFSGYYFEQRADELRRSFYKINVVSILALALFVSILLLISRPLLVLIFGEAYQGGLGVFRIVLLFSFLQGTGMVQSNFFSSTNRTAALSTLQVSTFSIGIGATFVAYKLQILTPTYLAGLLAGTYLLKVLLMTLYNLRFLATHK